MVDMTVIQPNILVYLIRPLNKGRGHSFWYQSISHNYTTSYRLSIVTWYHRTV